MCDASQYGLEAESCVLYQCEVMDLPYSAEVHPQALLGFILVVCGVHDTIDLTTCLRHSYSGHFGTVLEHPTGVPDYTTFWK